MTLRSIVRRRQPATPRTATAHRTSPARQAVPVARQPESDWAHLRKHAMVRVEESLDHVPTVLRRLGTFLLVGTVAMVAFLIAVVIILAHAVA
jgi:hypothetical protein